MVTRPAELSTCFDGRRRRHYAVPDGFKADAGAAYAAARGGIRVCLVHDVLASRVAYAAARGGIPGPNSTGARYAV